MATKRKSATSTGPKTPEGKAASSMNALRSGLYATTLILPGEDPAQFDRLRDGVLTYYQPENPTQLKLVNEMAELEWKLRRADLIEAGVLVELGDAPATACLQPFDRIVQVQCRLRRAWQKVVDRLEAIRRARHPPAPAASQSSQPSQPRPPEEEDFVATSEEYFNQDFTRNSKTYRRATKLRVWWGSDPNKPPEVLSRLYKGREVEEFPADDPAEIVDKYL